MRLLARYHDLTAKKLKNHYLGWCMGPVICCLMWPPQTLTRLTARCRGAGRALRYCDLVSMFYSVVLAEKERMEEMNETHETEEMEEITINYF